jgi:histidyl-tRNA synthetase
VLESRGVAPVIQAVLARSFEYYSGIVFKIYAGDARICSGGRYDELIGLIGERAMPASGFAHYLSPIVARLQDAGGAPAKRVCVTAASSDAAAAAAAHDAAARLRDAGLVVELAPCTGAAVEVQVAASSFLVRSGAAQREVRTLADVIAAVERAA